jgi:chemotaxis protein MotB
MKISKNFLMVLGVALISACSALEQPPAPNDTVSRLSNEMKAVPRVVPPKPDPRDARIAALEQQLADRDAELARFRTAAAEMQKLAQAQQGLVRGLQPEIQKGDISVDLNYERLQINLASAYLFGLGDDQLKPEGVNALKQVGAILKDYPEYNVEVAGHTDNLAIRSKLREKFPTNQALSEARAASAVTALTEGGIAANSLTTAGYAETKPVASNTTEVGRQKNRRVEIRVTPKS